MGDNGEETAPETAQATTEATPATPDATEVAAPSAGTRSDMVETAVKFLQNPKVKDAALSQKTAFLEKKGLTAAEIQLALDTVGGGGGGLGGAGGAIPGNPGGAYSPGGAYNPGYSGGPHVLAQPQAPPLGWKDYFVYTVMGAMSLYGAAAVAKEYVIPKLGWLGGDTAKQLETLNSSMSEFQTSFTERSEMIRESLDTTVEASTEMKQQLQGVLSRVAALEEREDRTAVAQRRSGETVTEELRHLKSLLLNRRSFAAPPAAAVSTDAPAAAMSPNVDKWTRMIAPQASGGSPALPSIPEWQRRAATETVTTTPPSESAPAPGTSSAGAPIAATPNIPAWQRAADSSTAPTSETGTLSDVKASETQDVAASGVGTAVADPNGTAGVDAPALSQSDATEQHDSRTIDKAPAWTEGIADTPTPSATVPVDTPKAE